MTGGGSPGRGGLTTAEAEARLERHGPNELVPARRRGALAGLLLRPLADPMAVLLLVAGATYVALGDRLDAAIVLVALVPIVLVTLVLEVRSERALDQLKRLTAPTALVWRDGVRRTVPAARLVPGDLCVLHEGDVVPADGDLVAGGPLLVDESALTGESQPVDKAVTEAAPGRLVFAGTTILSGRGDVRVGATGLRTRYGQIGALVAGIRQPPTPLERSVRRLVSRLGVVAAACCVVVAALELWRGAGWAAAVIAGVSLAIAAVPEEFPMVYTLYLTLGAWRLTRDRALIRRLAGVETLGSTTVICADKTGTLTLGHLEVVEGVDAFGQPVRPGGVATAGGMALLEAAVLASEPEPFDPLEQAIVRFAADRGVDVAALHAGALARDYPFDPVHRYMTHVWRRGADCRAYAKGALEGILSRGETAAEIRERALAANEAMAGRGMRVIAVAAGPVPGAPGDREADERGLALLGLVGFADPLRPGVAEALVECQRAGIRVLMITGDHPVTAHAVADALSLPYDADRPLATGDELDAADEPALGRLVRTVSLFARIRPEQKHRIVRALRAQGEVVAMTGDGINDAPALREADIGVALGQRGTAVARSAATLVLLDDNFATIVAAIRDGRRIFDNLRRAFAYLVAFHVPLVLTALLIPLMGAPLLLLPVHLIWLELLVHPTASLVFEADPGAADLMRRPPRPPRQTFLAGARLWWPLAEGIVLTAAVLALYVGRLGVAGEAEARALALGAMVLGQLGLVIVQRTDLAPAWRPMAGGNAVLAWVALATLASLGLALYAPPVTRVLHLAPLGLRDLVLAVLTALGATAWVEVVRGPGRRRSPPAPASPAGAPPAGRSR